MRIEYLSENKLKKMVKRTVGKYLPLSKYRLFFFGSRVRGDSFPRSDIDIGIEGEKELPAKIKLEIEGELENLPTLYKFELVDFKTVSSDFKNEALKYCRLIN